MMGLTSCVASNSGYMGNNRKMVIAIITKILLNSIKLFRLDGSKGRSSIIVVLLNDYNIIIIQTKEIMDEWMKQSGPKLF